jgi:catechol 2,3-dioxygenase-like lactoylglutathione lyase family enzyme
MIARVRPPALRHVTVTVDDLARSLAFYDAALQPLGLVRCVQYADEEENPADVPLEAVGFGVAADEPVLWLVVGPRVTSGLHLAFQGPSRAAVDAFHAAAITSGGASRQAPRRWEIYRPGYYGALVADPTGNLVEAFVAE